MHKVRYFIKILKFYSIMFSIMMTIWYSMSCEYSINFFILSCISTWATIFICQAFNLINMNRSIRYSSLMRVFSYYLWTIKAVFLASIDVTSRIWSVHGSSNSGFCNIKIPKTNEIGMVAFANSVTLTPGTISVYLDDDILIIHTLDTSLEKTLIKESAGMIKRVNKLIGHKIIVDRL